MNKLLIATTNAGKLKEISNFLSDLHVKTVSLKDVGITDDVKETGKTYKENSRKKAIFYSNKSGLPAISDDGGIEMDALDGGPGIRSRRFFGKKGKETSDEEIIKAMLKLSLNMTRNKRGARFITIVTLALPNGRAWSASGEVKGIIAKKPYLKLLKGYPYRSYFYLPQIKKYYHENQLSKEENKLYNHRYKALEQLKKIIARELKIQN